MTNADHIAPCPACNDDDNEEGAIYDHGPDGVRLECDCGCCGPLGLTMDEARAEWNRLARRTQLRPDTPNLNALEPFLFTIEPGWYWVGTGVRIGDQDRMLVVQKATDADVARLQGESAPRGPQCKECKGTGRIESPFHGGGMDCPHCGGKGWQPIKKGEPDA